MIKITMSELVFSIYKLTISPVAQTITVESPFLADHGCVYVPEDTLADWFKCGARPA